MQTTKVVKQLLKKYPELRKDSKRLVWAVWYKMGFTDDLGLHIDREKFYLAPSPESITRAKRKANEDLD